MELKEKFLSMIEFSLGCTEPSAIAYNTSFVGKYLPDATTLKIEIDKMTFKNAFAVGIPNSNGLHGTKNAAIFGFLIANPDLKLEIFKGLNNEIREKFNSCHLKVDIKISDKKYLYIHTTAKNKKGDAVEVITKKTHTGITALKKNSEYIIKKENEKIEEIEFEKKLYKPKEWLKIVDELYSIEGVRKKVKKAIDTNIKAAEFAKRYTKDENSLVFGAVYARMGGDNIEVASCAGSGNKGLTAIIPAVNFAKQINADNEQTTKAVILSCLITSLITAKFGFVSSTCGTIHAAGVGVLGAVLYLQNRFDRFFDAFKIYAEGSYGVFCDGAKKGCAAKAILAQTEAFNAINFALSNIKIEPTDGFLGESFEDTLSNFAQYDAYFKLFDRETIDILQKKF
ncbi:L-serine ammonia-lyase, iron-sulfur-dependent, subunit alpha [Hippea jasoniae]|uniref:L-serine ammonia-lyase, iron-sulfur-dependent, subunit alpha n=1 Tax=Hippea jasoniae TaxID=944479 RepID=UPI000551AC2E|nr:L-serine ammonia-lyase, iron-sulfur-dependent, subunit alpha [Hippea jasoniae]